MIINNIILDDKDYYKILGGIGYPIIDEETITNIIKKEDIFDLIIEPSLQTFNQYFPLLYKTVLFSSGANALQTVGVNEGIPDSAFAIFKSQFVSQTASTPGQNVMDQGAFYGNPFFSAAQVTSMGAGYGGGGGYFGTPYNYGFKENRYSQNFYAKSVESSSKIYYHIFDPLTHTLTYKSNIAGKFYFELACMNSNVNEIDYTKKQTFIDYCEAKLKIKIANMLNLVEMDLPIALNADKMEEDGKDKVGEIETYWSESSSFPMVR